MADDFQIPEEVLARIQESLTTLERQAYWRDIQATTERRLASVLRDGMESGDSQRDLSKRIREALGGDTAATRALTIARTETTGALNAGHHAAREQLIDDGLITGTEWVALIDDATRESHAALDGTVIAKGELFSVGGVQVPYPGHYSLSAAERVNCRCTTVAAGTFADEDE
jgi:SPP1 gp7 family putative phage head morphogenesis protein